MVLGARRYLRFAAGFACGLIALLAIGEILLRLAPPADVLPYTGAASPLTGPFVPDPVLGVTYRSYEEFSSRYAGRLADLETENAGRPVWAMFGNSFVQAPGMLGDTAQAALADRQMFHLRLNEPIYLRVAQFRLLLENGLRPERAFFVLLPIDLYAIALDPVAALGVTPGGAISRSIRKPPLLAPLLDHSLLALAAWIRSGRHNLLPGFRGDDVLKPLPALLTDELDALTAEIARAGRQYGVTVTMVFIPNRAQVLGAPSTVPQQAVGDAARKAGLDFVDTTAAFLGQSEPLGLFIPDWHFSARGNAVLLAAILAHLGVSPVGQGTK